MTEHLPLAQLTPELARIATLVHQRAGLTFPPNRAFMVAAGIQRAMRDAGIADPGQYERRLTSSATLMDDLFAELTVGETYFFRDPGQLSVVRDQVFPALRADVPPGHGIRVWSAGCATGEEPYTLGMMLAEAEMAYQAYVIGTDISRERLRVAQRGRYRQWSMRGVSDETIDRYFTRKQGSYDLSPRIRELVEFRYLNLSLDQYPSPALGVWAMDLILCRNVLIYFDPPTVAIVAKRMLDSLSLHGWLFLGASDPMLADYVDCEVVTTAAGLAYRRRRADRRKTVLFENSTVVAETLAAAAAMDADTDLGNTGSRVVDSPLPETAHTTSHEDIAGVYAPGMEQPLPESVSSPESPSPHDAAHGGTTHSHDTPTVDAPVVDTPALDAMYALHEYARVAEHATERVHTQTNDEHTWVLLVRSLANLGRIEEAERACTAALERRPNVAELWYLHAILLAEAGRYTESAQAARRSIYLDRHFVVAHLALGAALRQLGDLANARLAFTNALRILDQLPPGRVVPGADGDTSERIAMAARVQLQLAAEVA